MALILSLISPISARAATGIRGEVDDASGKPIAGVRVSASDSAVRATTMTDGRGRFTLSVPAGAYTLDTSSARFEPYAVAVVVTDRTAEVRIVLHPSLASLRLIGSVVAHPRNPFNATPAAVKVFPREAYRDQGQPDLSSVLAQTPGTAVAFSQSQNAAVAGNPIAPSVRGSLPFETAVSIDGVPVSIPSSGAFDLSLLPSSVLGDVEIQKGPGDVADIVPNAIAGAINFQTADPTITRRALFEFSRDDRGGAFDDIAYGGTMPGGKLAIVAVIADDGAIGPTNDRSYPLALGAGTDVNGEPLAQSAGNPLQSTDLVACCASVPSDDFRRAQLFKVRYTPTDATTLTATYLASQSSRALAGAEGMIVPLAFEGDTIDTFASLAPTFDARENTQFVFSDMNLHVDHGRDSFDGRLSLYVLGRFDSELPDATQELALDGVASFANGGPPQTFTGQLARISSNAGLPSGTTSLDAALDAQATWQHQQGPNLYSFSLEHRAGAARANLGYASVIASDTLVGDSIGNVAAFLHPNPKTEFDVGAAVDGHTDRYSQDNGYAFRDANWTFGSIRAAASTSVRPGVALRAAFGTSYAPPTLEMLSTPEGRVQTAIGLPSIYVSTESDDALEPETAIDYDGGVEWKLHGDTTTLSADLYRNVIHGEFALSQVSELGDFANERWINAPLVIDDGLELSLVQFKRVGLGFIAQGALLRNRVVGAIPSSFYVGDRGNLAILGSQNLNGGGFFLPGRNGLGVAAIPYAQGYGEMSYKWPRGSRLSLGALYEGANNPYNRPAFATLNSNLELSLGPKAKLQLSVTNLFNRYGDALPLAFGGIGVPLANGAIGATNANVLAPRTIRIMIRQSLGGGGVLER